MALPKKKIIETLNDFPFSRLQNPFEIQSFRSELEAMYKDRTLDSTGVRLLARIKFAQGLFSEFEHLLQKAFHAFRDSELMQDLVVGRITRALFGDRSIDTNKALDLWFEGSDGLVKWEVGINQLLFWGRIFSLSKIAEGYMAVNKQRRCSIKFGPFELDMEWQFVVDSVYNFESMLLKEYITGLQFGKGMYSGPISTDAAEKREAWIADHLTPEDRAFLLGKCKMVNYEKRYSNLLSSPQAGMAGAG